MDIYDSEDEHDNIFVKSFHAKSNLDFSLKRSLVLFEEVFRKPGVWDQFIPVYVQLLETNGMDLVKEFLKEYRDKNPLNPNSHRYGNVLTLHGLAKNTPVYGGKFMELTNVS